MIDVVTQAEVTECRCHACGECAPEYVRITGATSAVWTTEILPNRSCLVCLVCLAFLASVAENPAAAAVVDANRSAPSGMVASENELNQAALHSQLNSAVAARDALARRCERQMATIKEKVRAIDVLATKLAEAEALADRYAAHIAVESHAIGPSRITTPEGRVSQMSATIRELRISLIAIIAERDALLDDAIDPADDSIATLTRECDELRRGLVWCLDRGVQGRPRLATTFARASRDEHQAIIDHDEQIARLRALAAGGGKCLT